MKKTTIMHESERGSALILTLGVMSVVLMLAVAFLFSSRNALVVADAQVGTTSASEVAHSALDKQIGLLRYEAWKRNHDYDEGDSDYELGRFLPLNWNSATCSMDEGPDATVRFKFSADSDGNAADSTLVATLEEKSRYFWELRNRLTDFVDASDASFFPVGRTNDIYGRYGYVIIDESGKFDLNSVVAKTGNAPLIIGDDVFGKDAVLGKTFVKADGDYYYDITGGNNPASYTTAKRRGLHVSEISYPSVFRSQMPTVTKNSQSGKAGWDSFNHFYNELKDDSDSLDDLRQFLPVFRLFSVTEKINKPDVVNGDLSRRSSFFDLTGYEWRGSNSAFYDDDDKVKYSETGWAKAGTDGRFAFNLYKGYKWWGDDGSLSNLPDGLKEAYEFKSLDDYAVGEKDDAKDDTKPKAFLAYLKDNPQVLWNIKDYSDTDDHASFILESDTNKDDATWFDKDDADSGKVHGLAASSTDITGAVCTLGNVLNYDHIIMGNEKAPYIDEVSFEVSASDILVTPIDVTTSKLSATFSIIPRVKLVNIFNEDFTANGTLLVHFRGSYVFKSLNSGTEYAKGDFKTYDGTLVIDPDAPPVDYYYDVNFDWPVNGVGSDPTVPNQGIARGNVLAIPVAEDVPATSYKLFSNANGNFNYKFEVGTGGIDEGWDGMMGVGDTLVFEFSITDVVVAFTGLSDSDWDKFMKSDKRQYEEGSDNCYALLSGKLNGSDYEEDTCLYDLMVKKNISATANFSVPVAAAPGPVSLGDMASYISLQVSDPRCNHVSDRWDVYTGTALDDVVAYNAGGAGLDNVNFDPDGDGEAEDSESGVTFEGSDPKTYSTAYIRNAPMRSTWELGAIHTGSANRTVDLCKDTVSVDGENVLLLDCVKIGALGVRSGMMNPNSDNAAGFYKLFEGISLDDTYGVVDSDTTSSVSGICYNDEDDDAHRIENYLDESATEILLRRLTMKDDSDAFVVKFGSSDKLWSELNDRQREGYLARCAMLLSTRYEMYTILVYAEALEMLEIPAGADAAQQDAIVDQARQNSKLARVRCSVGGTTGDRWFKVKGNSILTARVIRDVKTNKVTIVDVIEE